MTALERIREMTVEDPEQPIRNAIPLLMQVESQLAAQSEAIEAAKEALKGSRPLVEAMIGIGSSARFVLPDIDAALAKLEALR